MQSVLSDVIVVTSHHIEGHQVEIYLGLVTGEAILGMNLVRDFLGGMADTLGMRAGAFEGGLRNARDLAIQDMVDEARRRGANAVISAGLQYSVVGESMMMVCATGTAVRVEALEDESAAVDEPTAETAGSEKPAPRRPKRALTLGGLETEQPVACFFCGKALGRGEARVGTLELRDGELRPLLCERHAILIRGEERPAVRTWSQGEEHVLWFRAPEYRPAWDFNPVSAAPTVEWEELPLKEELFNPSPHSVVHADDVRWAALQHAYLSRVP